MRRCPSNGALIAVICALLFNTVPIDDAYAQDSQETPVETTEPSSTEPSTAPAEVPTPRPVSPSDTSKSNQGFHAGLILSPVDLWVPAKIGVMGGYAIRKEHSFELEYTGAKFSAAFMGTELGSISEQRLAAVYRRFFGGSFNLIFGLSYNTFKIELGSEQLEDVTADERAHVDLFQVSNLGMELGLSNRWHPFSENFILQIDWMGLNFPITTLHKKTGIIDATSDPDLQDEYEKTFEFIEGIPRAYFLKLTLGWQF